MIAKLYDGKRLVGSLELNGRKPYSLRITYSLSGAIVELPSGLDKAMVGPSAVTEVYHKQVTFDVGTGKETISYRLAQTIEPSESRPRARRTSRERS